MFFLVEEQFQELVIFITVHSVFCFRLSPLACSSSGVFSLRLFFLSFFLLLINLIKTSSWIETEKQQAAFKALERSKKGDVISQPACRAILLKRRNTLVGYVHLLHNHFERIFSSTIIE